MRIAVTGLSMAYLSGQPLYCYTFCQELVRRGHEVYMVSDWDGPLTGAEGHKLKENLLAGGVNCVGWEGEVPTPDLIFCSENISQKFIDKHPDSPVINIVHSEYPYETPLENSDRIIAYICIRPTILEHIVAEHNVPRDKCHVIFNGVDRQRFAKRVLPKRDYKKVVIPCTLDTLREPFLNAMIDSATEKNRLFIYGMDCGAKLHANKWATIGTDVFDIENYIKDADEVAGILLGRTNLEAWSCGIPSRIYDPNTLESRVYPPPLDFDKTYNIVSVVDRLMSVTGNLDNITVVIPHYSARAELAEMLGSIASVKHVLVVKGGSFAENVNRGVSMVKTKYALIANDDITIKPQFILRNMMRATYTADIVGATPDNGCQGMDIKDMKVVEGMGKYPSGALLMVKTATWKELGGLDERYINGGEDLDLYLRAEKAGMKVKRIDDVYHHKVASTPTRYDKLDHNTKLFNEQWKGTARLL